jgi:hypothetical protein
LSLLSIISSFSKIIAVSHYTKSRLLEVLPNAIVTVITNGVFLPDSPPQDVPKKEEVAPKTEGSVINMYINGNTIMNERDVDIIGDRLVKRLNQLGIKNA